MFWLSKKYAIPKFDKQSEEALQAFANKNEFIFRFNELKQQYSFEKSNALKMKYMFSIRLDVRNSTGSSQEVVELQLRPNNWLLGLMGLLLAAAVLCILDERWRQPSGISFPLLVVIPYIYRLYAHKILSELKAVLIPGFDESAEGRKEVFRGYTNPLRFFLNLQRNLYILFVIVFLTAILLWMFGITDRFFPKP
jgi:hypothetical protein